jgi:Fe-S-cluster-containing hydrogenase component 2
MSNYTKYGYLDTDDIESFPSQDLLSSHSVAVSECIQEIPCNPCINACPVKAISMEGINGIPYIDFKKCTGCAKCIAVCPGLALFLVGRKNKKGLVTLPFEILPVPSKGDHVFLLDRKGDELGKGEVLKVLFPEKNKKSAVLTVIFDNPDLIKRVRNIRIIK